MSAASIAEETVCIFRRAAVQDGFLQRWSALLVATTSVQILVGISTVLWGVPKYIALLHQGVAIIVFMVALVVCHRIETAAKLSPRPEKIRAQIA